MTGITAGAGESCPRCSGRFKQEGDTMACPECGFHRYKKYSPL